jgi:hypothetical protein
MSTTATTPTPAGGPDEQAADPRRWVALAVVLTAGFMQLVDISIVNVAIPSPPTPRSSGCWPATSSPSR